MIVVDSSSIISIAVNCLCPILDLLDKQFAATPTVFQEMVNRPAQSKRFALESMRIQRLFNDGVIKTYTVDEAATYDFLKKANRTYYVKKKPLKIIHKAEAEALMLAKEKGAEAFLMDERTLRQMIEDPYSTRELLEHRNKKKVRIDEEALAELVEATPDVPIIRSTEIAAVAYEKGLLSSYMDVEDKKVLMNTLYALKLAGCSISWDEIKEYDALAI